MLGGRSGNGGKGGGMCEEEEVEKGRMRGNVLGGRGGNLEKEGDCLRRKRGKGGEVEGVPRRLFFAAQQRIAIA